MRAALYARVSTRDKGQDTAVQISELRNLVISRSWELAETITDTISGAKEKRPGLDRLWALCRARKVDVVLVYRFNRFARSTQQLVNALHEFQALGIQFVSLHEGVDTTTPNGRFVFHIFAALAEFERDLIRENVKGAMAYRQDLLRSQGFFVSKEGRRCERLGRPVTGPEPSTVATLRAQRLSWGEVARETGHSVPACRNALRRAVKTVPATASVSA